jgi:hypothetical protein
MDGMGDLGDDDDDDDFRGRLLHHSRVCAEFLKFVSLWNTSFKEFADKDKLMHFGLIPSFCSRMDGE